MAFLNYDVLIIGAGPSGVSAGNQKIEYQKAIKGVQKTIRDGRNFYNLFYNGILQNLTFRLAEGHNNIASYICDNLVSFYNYSYTQIPKIIFDHKLKK
jgi:hypothetical protein